MNPKVAREFVRTLEIGVNPDGIEERLSRIPKADWDAALSWLRRSGLALYWWARIKSCSLKGAVPESIGRKMEDDLSQNRVRLSAMTAELRSIIHLLQMDEIPYAVLKGFALSPEYCPDAALRSQYDFDFLVRSDSLRRLNSIL